jgi:hypothetical protein
MTKMVQTFTATGSTMDARQAGGSMRTIFMACQAAGRAAGQADMEA